MITITRVEIDRFRSIRSAEMADVADFSVLAGLNNSGKSNALRALHLFFTGQAEPDVAFDASREFFRGELSAKKKKQISVGVTFDLSKRFRFRKGLEASGQLLGRRFKITKVWSMKDPLPSIYLDDNDKPLDANESAKVQAFLNLITFRFIPNRVVPTDMIRREQLALRDVLVRRLAKYKARSQEVFDKIAETADALVQSLSDEIGRFAPDISQVKLATASSLADLAFRFGYQLSESGSLMDENEQGSGLQSLLMFQTYHLIDRDYFQQFGWKQAAIWVVEEPESSLNTALEAQVASYLKQIAAESKGRLQILATTHSDLMIQYADAGFLVGKEDKTGRFLETTITPYSTRELVKISSRFGVSRWVDPILFHPLEPILLVEGKYDRDFIMQSYQALSLVPPFKVFCLEDLLEDPTKGGVDTLIGFVQAHADAIKSRSVDAKVGVLLDWDADRRLSTLTKPFSAKDPFVARAWDRSAKNPRLTKLFGGIEAFCSDRLIQQVAARRSDLIYASGAGKKTVDPATYSEVKKLLNAEVLKGLNLADAVFAEPLLRRLAKDLG